MMSPMMVVDFLRLHLNSSSKVETALSVRAMELVRAAKSTSTKNITPVSVPKPMLAKTFGIVMNMRDGPA